MIRAVPHSSLTYNLIYGNNLPYLIINKEITSMKFYNLALILMATVALSFASCKMKPRSAYRAKPSSQFEAAAKEWAQFYKDEFDIDVDFSDVAIPGNRPAGYSQMVLLFIPKGLTPQRVFDSWSFLKQKSPDDFGNIWSSREPDSSYAVWVSWQPVPDAYWMGTSVDSADPGSATGITLLERMVFESKYYDEKRFHPDCQTVTLCSGSRLYKPDSTKDLVPQISCSSDKVVVGMRKVRQSDSLAGIRNVYR